MTNSQKITLRMSEVRERLNTISGIEGDDFTAEIRSESEKLRQEYQDLEARHRAAIVAETREAAPVDREDSEGKEIRSLIRRSQLSNFVLEAWNQQPVDGNSPEAELRAAMFSDAPGSGQLPWAMLADPETLRAETRADTATELGSLSFPNRQARIIQRVFSQSAAQFLGIDMPSVPVGTTAYPVLETGATGEPKSRGTAQDAVAATFTSSTLSPVRITARYVFAVEDAARLSGMEDALRADLRSTMSDAVDRQALTGNGTSPNVSGILKAITAPDNPADVFSWADAVKSVTGAVDGKHASQASDVRLLVPSDLYPELSIKTMTAGVTRTSLEYLESLAGGVRVSGNLPLAPSTGDGANISTGIVSRQLATGAVAPIWEGVSIVRDPYSGAASGEVALTVIALWSFKVIRSQSFILRKYKLA